MMKTRRQLYQIYHAVLSMTLTWTLTLVINQFLRLKGSILLMAGLSLLFTLIIFFVDLFKKNVITYLLLSALVPVFALILLIGKLKPLQFLHNYYDWFRHYSLDKSLYWAPGAYFSLILVALLWAVLFYIITKNQIAKTILAILFLCSLFILCINRVIINKAVIGIIIFYIMTVVTELYGYIFGRKERRNARNEGILYLAPVCILLALLCVSFPAKQEPMKWIVVKNAYNSIRHSIQSRLEFLETDLNYYFGGGDGEFLLSMTGYSEDSGKLDNGELTMSNNIAMKVTGLTRMDTAYLTGSVSNVYTGNSWESSGKDYLPDQQDYLLDYSELFFLMSRQNWGVLQENSYIKMKAIKINYRNIKTKTFFYPLKSTYFDLPSTRKKLAEDSAKITFHKPHGRGTNYKTTYYEMNLNDERFQKILRKEDSFTYDNIPIINLKKLKWLQKEMFSRDEIDSMPSDQGIYKILGDRARLIETEDTQLPSELPDRVRKLAYQITEGYTTKYDKLKAIEKYLLSYTYTLKPEKAPEGEDFVDYFLFESKEGYCTSFASAMAVLGRCIGIPTRYVEGFVVNGKYGTGRDVVPVKNSQAHAWAEAYIEGVGWIPFEATAPYYTQRYVQWPESKKTVSVSSPIVDRSSYYASMQNKAYIPFKQGMKTKAKKNKANELGNILLIIIAVLLCMLLAVLIYYNYLKNRFKKTYEGSDYGDRMYLLFLQILGILKLEGFSLEPQETILMLTRRVRDHIRVENITFKDVADIFMRYRYAEAKITDKQLEKVDYYRKGLIDKRKGEVSKFGLWLEDFIYLIRINRQRQRRYSNI